MPITKKIIVLKKTLLNTSKQKVNKTQKTINRISNKNNTSNIFHKKDKLNHELKHELNHELQHTYNKYYPSILNPNFGNLITNHKLFKNYKLKHNEDKLQKLYKDFEDNTISKIKTDKSNVYILKPTQKLLRNFMSPYTPYRGLLIYHEMGVGKTCTAISIAENLKEIVTKSNTKIYVIRPDEIERQIFNINVVKDGTPDKQCTGDTYIDNVKYNDLVKKCSQKHSQKNSDRDVDSCSQLKTKVDKDIKKIYEFYGSQMWANNVNKEIESKTKNIEDDTEKENKIKTIIKNNYNNAVIIIDEAHEMRDSGLDGKVVPPVLMMVLKYASNLRLIFLSATPIYDKPQNIVSMINYFLINDNRPIMKEGVIFDSNGNLKASGKTILENNLRGYISYLRGNNPYDFPIRLSAKYNIPKQMLNLDKYPSKDISGRTISREDAIKHLELVDCPFQGEQLKFINYYIKNSPTTQIKAQDFEGTEKLIVATLLSSKKENHVESKTSNSENNSENNSESNESETHDSEYDIVDIQQNVAYNRERQLSNFIYQSLGEANNNMNLITGSLGLQQVAVKKSGKLAYEFKDPLYGKRFLLPELKNWGVKIAMVLERALVSTGPIFIYSYFKDSGVIPMIFALEMNGFKRYKQNNKPLLENPYKDNSVNRGEYIVYTGDQQLSQFAKEYLDKGKDMIKEKNVKVFIGTSKASEGLNLFGYREVHILDPWHNINLIEQTIGRVIRTGSHLHLPPQERNVSVYQYATTLKDRETYDLKMYKISETKAINAGIVEKLMKENAFDCELNRDVNIYSDKNYGKEIPLMTSNNKQIKISLADKPYSRSCFYMKDCDYKCFNNSNSNSKIKSASSSDTNTTTINLDIMRFNIDKDIDEFKKLIKQLMKSSFNININNLKLYLKNMINGTKNKHKNKDKESSHSNLNNTIISTITTYLPTLPTLFKKKLTLKNRKVSTTQSHKNNTTDTIQNDDFFEEAFSRAIQDIINEDTIIIDKFNRNSKIVLGGNTLRLVPENNTIPNIAIEKQEVKPSVKTISSIDLKTYINELSDKQTSIVSEEQYNYDEIITKNIIEKAERIYYGTDAREYKYNVKIQLIDIIEFVFYRLSYLFKKIVIKTILGKIINGTKSNNLTINEQKLEKVVKSHIIYLKDIFPNTKDVDGSKTIYGFIIQNVSNLELFVYNEQNKTFENNSGNIKKVVEFKYDLLDKTPKNKLYGFLKYEKNNEVSFKITDIVEKGEKKSVKGITCTSPSTTIIKNNLAKLDSKLIKNIVYNSKTALCNDFEMLLKHNDDIKLNNKKWFYTPEDYYIYFEYNKT